MGRVQPVNMRQVASAAGVSHMTVSRVLNGGARVAPGTRDQVMAAVKRLGYRMNPLVKAYTAQIRGGRNGELATSCNLAFVVSDPDSPHPRPAWLVPWLRGVETRSEELGYGLDTDLNLAGMSDRALLRLITGRGIRGLLIPLVLYHGRTLPRFEQLAITGIGETRDSDWMHRVSPDYFLNMQLALDCLQARGYRRLGVCLTAHSIHSNHGQEMGGYLQYREESAGCAFVKHCILGDVNEPSTESVFMSWVKQERPDAIVGSFNHPLFWLRKSGYRVPEDIAVTHLGLTDDTSGWSGVDYRAEAVGSAAVDLLTAHIVRNEYGIPEIPKRMHIPGVWRDGETARPG